MSVGSMILFYYESRKRELETRLIYEDRCNERLKNSNGGIYTPRIHWVTPFLLSYILRYVSFEAVGDTCRFVIVYFPRQDYVSKRIVCLFFIDKTRTKDKTYI
jgi:hypothetical protein